MSIEFEKNISDDQRAIMVSREELSGLDDDFIGALTVTDGKYRLGTDYPTYHAVMEFCSDAETRKQLYELFQNRAYPKNKHVLEQIIARLC